MSAHGPGCTYDHQAKRWTARGEGCAAPEEHPEDQRPVEPLTEQEAKARVARGVAGMLEAMAAQTEAGLEALPDGVAKENERKMAAAARQLRGVLLVTAKRMERPKILQPARSRRVLRN
jgi:hypothetical protein